MAKSRQTFQKSDKEKKKKQKQQEKEEKRAQRKENSNKGKGFESMVAYVDYNGNLTDTQPDPRTKVEIKAEDILLGPQTISREVTSTIQSGRISIYNADRRFGFIKDQLSQEKIFFHASEIDYDPIVGDRVNYELAHGPKGLSAVNVTKQKS